MSPKSIATVALLSLTFVNADGEEPISSATAQRLLTRTFFVFDNGAGRDAWTPDRQAETLARLGYAGIGYSGTGEIDERLKAFERSTLRIFNIYVGCNVNESPMYGDDLKAAIKRLDGTGVAIWLTVQGQSEDDAKAVQAVTEIAELAAVSGLSVALYPHAGFHVSDIEDALRIVDKVNRENVGVTFNLCHELKAGNEARFDEILEKAAPRLFFVSINGADHEGGWDKLIQPLGKGSFDVTGLLRKLNDLKYEGPIGLQCYQVPGDTLANLEHNIAQWRAIVADLAGKEKDR